MQTGPAQDQGLVLKQRTRVVMLALVQGHGGLPEMLLILVNDLFDRTPIFIIASVAVHG